MKKSFAILAVAYIFSLTACATTDMENSSYNKKLDEDYKAKLEQERYDKMLGKTKPVNIRYQPPFGRYEYVGKEGKPVFVPK